MLHFFLFETKDIFCDCYILDPKSAASFGQKSIGRTSFSQHVMVMTHQKRQLYDNDFRIDY